MLAVIQIKAVVESIEASGVFKKRNKELKSFLKLHKTLCEV